MSIAHRVTSGQPLVFQPSATHQTTMIVLHGRGSIAEKFALPLLEHPVFPSSSNTTLPGKSRTFQEHFPHTKFVFPTAPLRRARDFNRLLIHQWFDVYSSGTSRLSSERHVKTNELRDSVSYTHKLLEEAGAEVGAENVFLMGLSQGCSTGLVAMLLWEGEELGAFVGMCGCLPLRTDIKKAWKLEKEDIEVEEDDEDIFETSEATGEGEQTELEFAADWLREELGMSSPGNQEGNKIGLKNISVFLGHGTEDEKVPFKLGKETAEFLTDVGVEVGWNEYTGLGHWYSADMLRDIVNFLIGAS